MNYVERQAVRAMLVTPEREILLMRIRNPVTQLEFWVCPGGGLEPGESFAEGLRRELREELGLTVFEAHHVLWKRHHTFNWKEKRISQHETFYVVHVPARFAPVISDPVEKEVVQEFRWWALPEVEATQESVTPRSLAAILKSYYEKGPPEEGLIEEVLFD